MVQANHEIVGERARLMRRKYVGRVGSWLDWKGREIGWMEGGRSKGSSCQFVDNMHLLP